MPVFELTTEQGTYRITANSEEEARARYQQGQGELMSPLSASQPPAVSPETPSPMRALWGAVSGTQRLPGQAGAPPEGASPTALAETASKESTPGKVVNWFTGAATDPANIGEAVGTAVAPPGWKPVGGALGAGVGEGVREWWQGEPLSPANMLREGLASGAVSTLESAALGATRQFARNSPGGQRLRFDQAAEEARGTPERVFQPRERAAIGADFNAVRASNLPIDATDLRAHITTLPAGVQDQLHNVLTGIDRTQMTGGRFAQAYQDLRAGTLQHMDIGTLQDLRSQLRQEADAAARAQHHGAAYELRRTQNAVDDVIDNGFVSQANQATATAERDRLHTARADWARRNAADDMSGMIEGHITSSPDLASSAFSLRGFYDELRRGRSEVSRSVNRALDLTPGARQAFDTELQQLSRLYQTIELPMADVAGISRMPVIAAARQGISTLLLSDWGRRQLREWVIEGRGRLSQNALALLVNAGRRELLPEATRSRPQGEGVQSWFAPGGVARSTD